MFFTLKPEIFLLRVCMRLALFNVLYTDNNLLYTPVECNEHFPYLISCHKAHLLICYHKTFFFHISLVADGRI